MCAETFQTPESRGIISARKATSRERRACQEEVSRSLTQRQRDELEALAGKPDEDIDTRDAPEVSDRRGAKRGAFYRPVKRQLTLCLDADVVEWFKARTPKGYQTRINRALRDYVEAHDSE